jgi:hypothetical protein
MRSGLDTASEASCTMIEAIPSAPPSPFGLTVCISECRWATVGIADKCEPDFSSPDSAADDILNVAIRKLLPLAVVISAGLAL